MSHLPDPESSVEGLTGLLSDTDDRQPEQQHVVEAPRPQEKKPVESSPWSASFWTVVLVATLGELSRGLFVASLWPYFSSVGGSQSMLGVVSGAFSFSRMIGAPVLGVVADRVNHRTVLLLATVLLLVGNFFFALFPPVWLFILCRLVIGIGASTLGEARGFVSLVTSSSQLKTVGISRVQSFQFAAGTVGQLFVAPFAFMPASTLSSSQTFSFTLSPLNMGAWILVALSAVALILLLTKYKEPKRFAFSSVSTSMGQELEALPSVRQRQEAPSQPTNWRAVAFWSLLLLSTRFSIAVFETLFVLQTSRLFGWTLFANCMVLATLGAAGFGLLQRLRWLSDAVARRWCRGESRQAEMRLLFVGMAAILVGTICVAFTPEPSPDSGTSSGSGGISAYRMSQFLFGAFLIWAIGSALTQTLVNTLMSQELKSSQQAGLMGLLAAWGSVARILGGLWSAGMTGFPVDLSDMEVEEPNEPDRSATLFGFLIAYSLSMALMAATIVFFIWKHWKRPSPSTGSAQL